MSRMVNLRNYHVCASMKCWNFVANWILISLFALMHISTSSKSLPNNCFYHRHWLDEIFFNFFDSLKLFFFSSIKFYALSRLIMIFFLVEALGGRCVRDLWNEFWWWTCVITDLSASIFLLSFLSMKKCIHSIATPVKMATEL